MSSIRECILQRLKAIAQSVPGIEPGSASRERAAPYVVAECPSIDVSPESDESRTVGAGLDAHEAVEAALHGREEPSGGNGFALQHVPEVGAEGWSQEQQGREEPQQEDKERRVHWNRSGRNSASTR